jgi:uncharacterized RDD family membrane protein YckC
MATKKKKTGKKLDRAGFGIRLGAHILDNIIQVFANVLIVAVLLLPWILLENLAYGESELALFAIPFYVLVALTVSFLNQCLLVKKTGQSLGKRMVGIKIIKDKGELGWSAVITRWLVKGGLFFLGLLGALAYSIPIMVTEEKKSIGDYAAETSVIKIR